MELEDLKVEIESPITAQPVMEKENQLQHQVQEQVNMTAIKDAEA